ncbi:restriction endonuclease subunit S [Gilliamella sp. wkB171]|uniref:restriction endonuclease subunit S n=1 Tax=Gilliamella sp. wkB171 TaxID=3120258 RepID=UPI0009E36AE2|nr:restriction endonuclease subunit S [Gilliamella apicola]
MASIKSKVPKLRFKGFSGEWKRDELSKVINLRNESGNKEDFDVDIELENLVIDKGIIIGDTSIRTQSNSIFKKNDILFGKLRPYLNKWWLANCDGIKSGEIWALYPKQGFSNLFIYGYIQTYQFLKAANLTSGTKMPRADWSILKEQSINFPLLEEQTQIGDFFQKLDQVIELQQHALTQAQNYKKAMLQKMFPQKDEKVPRIRFKGFSGEWNRQRLREYTKLITKGTTPKNQLNTGPVNFVKVENISYGIIKPNTKISQEEHENYLRRSKLEENDILFSIAGTLGRVAIVNKSILPANTNQALSIIRGYNYDTYFLMTILSGKVVTDYIRKNPTVGAQPNLSLEQIGNLEVCTPSIQEQTQIGNFFQQLDKQITEQQNKLTHYQTLKKAMLQRLFI